MLIQTSPVTEEGVIMSQAEPAIDELFSNMDISEIPAPYPWRSVTSASHNFFPCK